MHNKNHHHTKLKFVLVPARANFGYVPIQPSLFRAFWSTSVFLFLSTIKLSLIVHCVSETKKESSIQSKSLFLIDNIGKIQKAFKRFTTSKWIICLCVSSDYRKLRR